MKEREEMKGKKRLLVCVNSELAMLGFVLLNRYQHTPPFHLQLYLGSIMIPSKHILNQAQTIRIYKVRTNSLIWSCH